MPRGLSLARAASAAVFGGAIALAALAFAEPAKDKEGFPPDPPQHASNTQWVFDVQVTHGTPDIVRARPVPVAHAVETVRVVGRFAFEIYVGPELLDRIRFDVPLMGAGPTEKSPKHPFPRPGFEDVKARLELRMADNPRAVYAVLIDRQTRKSRRYQWPPDANGKLQPWIAPKYESPDAAWPPPGATPDAGARD